MRTFLAEVDSRSSRTAQARDMDTHSRLPGCTGEFQTHPETVVFVQKVYSKQDLGICVIMFR